MELFQRPIHTHPGRIFVQPKLLSDLLEAEIFKVAEHDYRPICLTKFMEDIVENRSNLLPGGFWRFGRVQF